jgi:quercetin dioxygenase-like cupin family protein
VLAGEVWLTLEGDAEDYWLAPGQSFNLPRDAVAWLSAGRHGARVALSYAGGRGAAMRRVTRAGGWNWLPRWLLAA